MAAATDCTKLKILVQSADKRHRQRSIKLARFTNFLSHEIKNLECTTAPPNSHAKDVTKIINDIVNHLMQCPFIDVDGIWKTSLCRARMSQRAVHIVELVHKIEIVTDIFKSLCRTRMS